MKPIDSCSHSQQPATWTTINLVHAPSNSWRSILILFCHLNAGLPSGLFPSGFPTKTLCTSSLSPTRATSHAHLILLGLKPRIIFGEDLGLQTVKLLEMQSSLSACYLVPHGSKYLPQDHIFKNPRPMFLPQHERPCFTLTQNEQSLYYNGLLVLYKSPVSEKSI